MASASLLTPVSVVSFFTKLRDPLQKASRHRAYGPHQGGTSETQGDAVALGIIRSRVEFRPFTVLSCPLKAVLMTSAAAVPSHQPRQSTQEVFVYTLRLTVKLVHVLRIPQTTCSSQHCACRVPVDVGTRQEGKQVLWERERQNVTTNATTITGGEAFEKPNGQRTPTARALGDASA